MDLNSSPENDYIRRIIQSAYMAPVGLDQDFFQFCAAYNTSLARRYAMLFLNTHQRVVTPTLTLTLTHSRLP